MRFVRKIVLMMMTMMITIKKIKLKNENEITTTTKRRKITGDTTTGETNEDGATTRQDIPLLYCLQEAIEKMMRMIMIIVIIIIIIAILLHAVIPMNGVFPHALNLDDEMMNTIKTIIIIIITLLLVKEVLEETNTVQRSCVTIKEDHEILGQVEEVRDDFRIPSASTKKKKNCWK